MSNDWQAFDDELACWHAAGRRVEFWWRDDDASEDNAALRQLIALADTHDVPLALAVIPLAATRSRNVISFAKISEIIVPVQHGCDHINRASAGHKKNEFPAGEAPEAALRRLLAARDALFAWCGERALSVLVPPWNRLNDELVPLLAQAGYVGLSRFGPRVAGAAGSASQVSAAPGQSLIQANTHVDVIDWRGSRGFAGEATVLAQAVAHLRAKREGRAPADEPTGWLSHHAVHDIATWSFLESLFARTRGRPGVAWLHATEIFAPGRVAGG